MKPHALIAAAALLAAPLALRAQAPVGNYQSEVARSQGKPKGLPSGAHEAPLGREDP